MISLEALEKLALDALTDDAALKELGRVNEQLGRRLNARMRRLEKAGETEGAYKSIMSTIGGKRASQAHTGTGESLYRSAEAALKSLKYKGSTLSGIKDRALKEAESLFGEADKRKAEAFHRLGKAGALDEFKKAFGGSSFFTALRECVEAGADLEDLLNGYNSMIEGQGAEDIFELWENWSGIEL